MKLLSIRSQLLLCFISFPQLLHNELVPDIPFVLATKLMYQASKGMHFLHSSGIVHRDLKSLNLLLDAKWNVKVLCECIRTPSASSSRRLISSPLDDRWQISGSPSLRSSWIVMAPNNSKGLCNGRHLRCCRRSRASTTSLQMSTHLGSSYGKPSRERNPTVAWSAQYSSPVAYAQQRDAMLTLHSLLRPLKACASRGGSDQR